VSEQQEGFELNGHFYPWRITYTTGKDMMLIDRLTGLSLTEFMDVIETGRLPLSFRLVAVAISIRHEQPEWTVARIVRTVEEMDFEKDFTDLSGEEEEGPPTTEPVAETPTGEPSRSPPSASSPPSTPRDNSGSKTSSGIPV